MANRYKFESLAGSFPRPLTTARRYSPFKKTWGDILNDLFYEMGRLNYRTDSCVIMTAHPPYYVNKDGTLRSGAPKPEHPGVVVKFEVWNKKQSRYEKMVFDCDRFVKFEANVQAIAGAMEALRKVERYGVTNAGRDQYAGFKALPPMGQMFGSPEAAAAFIATHSGLNRHDIEQDKTVLTEAFRKAALKLHPDQGGDHADFAKLNEARKVLEAA